MNRLTVEETNLLSIYHEGSKAQLIENMTAALPYKTLSFSKIEGRHGTYALIDKGENRDKEIKKPRPSVRAQLAADKKTAAPKKSAAIRKNHDLEV